jgi:UDP-N-acetylmuramoylalanine--D-glutamate ligase
MNIPDDVLIVGLGRTGIATARYLAGLGKKIFIADEKPEADLAPALEQLKDIRYTGRFGPHEEAEFLAHPMIVISPGVDSELPVLKKAMARGVRVAGEMELASSFVGEPIIAITGTNGKTTVTTLMGEIFREAFPDVFVGGNIGNPLINYLIEGRKAAYLVLEVSSFQLETIEGFRPDAAILLNVTEDHLDRYRSYEEYKAAKYRIFKNQRADDRAILNADLPAIPGIRGRKFYFSSHEVLREGAFAADDKMRIRLDGKEYTYRRDLSPLVGVHNTENLLVTLLTAHLTGIDQGTIERVVSRFKGLDHRVEFVRELKGVKYYNDSKATNVDAAKRALESMGSGIILIAGGKDKGGTYLVMSDLMRKVKAMVLLGEAKERIKSELGGLTETYMTGSLQEAVDQAARIAGTGDTVLFSPMCSSFDMFKDYKDRGNTFRQIVESL